MNQIGITPSFPGLNQPQPHQTANPTNSQASAPATGGITPTSLGVVGVPVYPVVLMPAFMMAQPQLGGAYAGQPGVGQPAADGAPTAGAHVTSNPTNAMPGDLQGGQGGYGGYAGYGGAMMGMPMMMSPVLMALGFPMMSFYGGQQASSDPVATTSPAVDDAPVIDDALPPVVETAAPPPVEAPDEAPVIDVTPPAVENASLPTLPIAEVSAEDFSKYRLLEAERKSESSLSLMLTTNDGDVISLDFSQMDISSSSKFNGKTLDGERIKDYSMTEDTERLVNMEVSGSLSDEEQGAIDAVLSSVIDVVQEFFSGNMEAAIGKLKMMDFDTAQLGELSLNMSMSKTAEVSRAYHNGGDQMHDLKSRDADISQALEFLASEQRRLIDVAGSVLEAPSAAKLVKSLMPPLLSEPFSALQAELAAASEDAEVEPVAALVGDQPNIEDAAPTELEDQVV